MRRTGVLISAVATFVILGGVGLVAVGMMRGGRSVSDVLPLAGSFDAAAPSASPTPTGPSPQEIVAATRAVQVKALNKALSADAKDKAQSEYAGTVPEFSVSVLDRKTGQRYSFRGTEKYETASVVKVQVLACLLLTVQDKGRALTSSELALAKRMIRASDNDATTSLFNKLGQAKTVGACNKRLGLTSTKVNIAWGLTQTTANDQVKLLTQLVDAKSPLTAESRKLAFSLMSTVEPDQDWGVPSVATPGDVTTVKNGWLTRSTKRGSGWIINSVGRVTSGDTDVSIAVLSRNNASMTSGIKVVEKAAKLTRLYLKY